jgi:hypothetical protein
MKKLKTKTGIFLIIGSLSMITNAGGYSDYLKVIQAEANNFNPNALSSYVIRPDYQTKEEKLQLKLLELEGFWSNVLPIKVNIKVSYDKIEPTNYLQALADSDRIETPEKNMTPMEAIELRKLEDEIVDILNNIGS